MNETRTRIQPPSSRALALGLVLAGGIAVPSLSLALDRLPLGDPLADTVLDQQRGGFRIGNLEISIGLEQIVAINGDIQIVNRLTIPNLNQSIRDGVMEQLVEVARPASGQSPNTKPSSNPASPSPASPSPTVPRGTVAEVPVVRGGTDTIVSVPAAAIAREPALVAASELRNGGWITQIQNSLDQTLIQNIRSLNIQIDNVGVPSVNVPEVSGSHLLLSPNR